MLENGAHSNLNCVLNIILMMILPFLGFLFWLENKVRNSSEASNHYSKWKELMQFSDEINSVFYQQDEEKTNVHCACSYCARLSDTVTRCSRCKAAIFCSNACHVIHLRFCHKYECVEVEESEDQQESPSQGTHFFLMEPENDKYSFNEIEERRYEGDVYCIDGGENSDVFSDETAMPHGIVNGNDGCAVCGTPSTKVCSRCKAIKYCSRTCQHFDWRSGHKFQCLDEKANSSQVAMVNQDRPAHGNVVNLKNSYAVEDNAHSSSPLCLKFCSGNTNSRALISSSLSQETTNNVQKEVEEQLRNLKEELAKIRDENISLRSERAEWEALTRNSIDRFHSFRKDTEHQLFILKHENELISNAEKQARQMVNSLSQRLHCLQIAVESGVEERRKQEEYIHMLQNECTKARIELQEQNRCIERLTLKLDKNTHIPARITEEARQKFVNAFSEIAAAESNAAGAEAISLSRNPTHTRQGCSICQSNEKNMTFGCGHMTCTECGTKIRKCHICRKKITIRIRLFPN